MVDSALVDVYKKISVVSFHSILFGMTGAPNSFKPHPSTRCYVHSLIFTEYEVRRMVCLWHRSTTAVPGYYNHTRVAWCMYTTTTTTTKTKTKIKWQKKTYQVTKKSYFWFGQIACRKKKILASIILWTDEYTILRGTSYKVNRQEFSDFKHFFHLRHIRPYGEEPVVRRGLHRVVCPLRQQAQQQQQQQVPKWKWSTYIHKRYKPKSSDRLIWQLLQYVPVRYTDVRLEQIP